MCDPMLILKPQRVVSTQNSSRQDLGLNKLGVVTRLPQWVGADPDYIGGTMVTPWWTPSWMLDL